MKRVVGVFLGCGVVLLALQIAFGYWVLIKVPEQLGFKIHGDYQPVLWGTRFRIKNAKFEWKDRVSMSAGDLDVSYDLFSVFSADARIEVKSTDALVELKNGWSRHMQGMETVRLTNFYADLVIGDGRLREICSLDATGPSFQFHFKEAD